MCVRRGVIYLYLHVSIRDWYLRVYTNMCTCACVYVCMCVCVLMGVDVFGG